MIKKGSALILAIVTLSLVLVFLLDILYVVNNKAKKIVKDTKIINNRLIELENNEIKQFVLAQLVENGLAPGDTVFYLQLSDDYEERKIVHNDDILVVIK